MTRKLLPFEHELIATLGISKDDYLEFIALQETYKDPKEGTIFDIRNEPVSITIAVLSLIGTVFTVVSSLLNQPQIPSLEAPRGGGQPQTRDERFSPRFGFNSTQELAAYGDPVNLVYANRGTGTGTNPNGGVRVTASLLWSAVRSYGSSQFIQMLMMLSGGAITAIDTGKTAFGQTPLRDLMTENIWMYFDPGATGLLQRQDEVFGKENTDPTRYGKATDNPYRLQPSTSNTRTDGFSQAYSPTTANTVGVYGVVPLNIWSFVRNSRGDKMEAPLFITASGISWTAGTGLNIGVNEVLSVKFNQTNFLESDNDAWREAKDIRRSLLSVFDTASLFKLGTALFRVSDIPATNIDEQDITIKLTCIKAGQAPRTEYSSVTAASATGALTAAEIAERNKLKNSVQVLLDEDQRPSITTALQLVESGEIQEAVYHQIQQEVNDANAFDYIGAGRGQIRRLKPGVYGYGYKYGQYRWVTAIKGYQKKRELTASEKNTLRRYSDLEAIAGGYKDDIFYTKALARIATATYETLSACHIVDFALKAIVFKRISGRQLEYGSERRGGYPVSDNGIKTRVSLFKLNYREVGQTVWATAPGTFAISRAADNENFVYFKFNSGITDPDAATHWEFELEPVVDPLSEAAINDNYYYLTNAGNAVTETLGTYKLLSKASTTPSIQFVGEKQAAATGAFPPKNNNPADLNEWDLFNYDADTQLQFSFDSGPEITITAVTEQLIQPFTDYNQLNASGKVVKSLYNNLALLGFNAYSGKTIQDLRSFTVFATQGRSVRRLRTSGTDENSIAWGSAGYRYYPSSPDGASSLAPDIFLDTVLDKEDGIGNYAVVNALDLKQLAITKRFCIKNKLFMDCVIADPRSWREFWVEVAPYNLLEFARIGGRETLVPAVPYKTSTGEITRSVTITALFNQGNILEDSYKEEYIDYGSNAQDIIANVIYTDMPDDAVFAKKKSVEVVLKDTVEVDAIRQTFDISNYVSSYDHAVLFGKLLCNTRRYVRQAIEFKTYPTSDPISPGAYIYVDIGQNAWDAIRTGVIGSGGTLNTPLANTPADGTYNFRLYRSDKGMVSLNNVALTNGTSTKLKNYEGYLFVLGVEATKRRVFRVTEVQMDEEGETTVRATIYPCTSDGESLIADFSNSLFTVRS
jgi:hypothetical protein